MLKERDEAQPVNQRRASSHNFLSTFYLQMPFSTSTHAKHWIFTSQELVNSRQKCDLASRSKLQPGVDPISIQEQNMLRAHYEYKIPDVCKRAGLPEKCQATAIIYFKRFYLSYTVMDYDPKIILLTCIYLATKTEESRMAIDDLSKRVNIPTDKLLQNEVVLLQGIKFELMIYHPFRPLQGFLWDLADSLGIDSNEIKNQAHQELNNIMPTDLPLLYSPSLLALAALYKVTKQSPNPSITQYISETLSKHAQSAQETILEIAGAMEGPSKVPLPADTVRGLDRKLKQCTTRPLDQDPEAKAWEAEKQAEKQKVKALQHTLEQKADLEFMTKPS